MFGGALTVVGRAWAALMRALRPSLSFDIDRVRCSGVDGLDGTFTDGSEVPSEGPEDEKPMQTCVMGRCCRGICL